MRIVVGYDGSEASRRALDRVAAVAGDETQVVVIAAAEPCPRSGITIPANYDAAEIRRRRQELDEARKYLAKRGIAATTIATRGTATRVLLDAARHADLAVVGSRRLNPLRRFILGSVSSKVVHDARCDVLVVR